MSCDNSETVRDRICQLLLITKQEVAYGLSIGTDLDDLERRVIYI